MDAVAKTSSGLSQQVASLQLRATDPQTAVAADARIPAPGLSKQPSPAAVGQDLVTTLLEEFILHNAEGLAAASAVERHPRRFPSQEELRTDEGLARLFAAQDFDLAAEPGWTTLGIRPLDGPEPTAAFVETRARIGTLMADIARSPAWTGSADWAAGAERTIETARQACQAGMAEALQRRPRTKVKLPRWAEGGACALKILQELAGPGELILTQLSNSLNLADRLPPAIRQIDRARSWVERILTDGPEVIQSAGLTGATLWCPQDPGVLGRLLAAMNKHCVEVDNPVVLRLVSLLSMPPGCMDPRSCLELAPQPTLHAKWAHIVKNAPITAQPVALVTEGAGRTQTKVQPLLIVELGPAKEVARPQMLQARDIIGTTGQDAGLLIDCRAQCLAEVQRSLDKALTCLQHRVLDPVPSLGSTPDESRKLIRVIFPAGTTTKLDRAALVRNLSTIHFGTGMFVADDSIVDDNAGLLLEVLHPDAALALQVLCSEMAFVNPKRLLVQTDASAERWAQAMGDMLTVDTDKSAVRLRWRASRMGGRTMAQPDLTSAQAGAIQREARRAALPSSTHAPREVVISAPGFAGFDGQELIALLLQHLAANGVHFQQGPSLGPLRGGQWRPEMDGMGAKPTGRLTIAVLRQEDAQTLKDLLDEKVINMGNAVVTLQVHEDSQAVQQAKNDRRARPRRAH